MFDKKTVYSCEQQGLLIVFLFFGSYTKSVQLATVSKIIRKGSTAICVRMSDEVSFPETDDEKMFKKFHEMKHAWNSR